MKNKIISSVLFSAIALAGCNAQAEKTNFNNLSQSDKDQIGKIASDYIIDHPDVLIKASNKLQSQQEEQQKAEAKKMVKAVLANKEKLLSDPSTPVYGPQDAKVALIEFFDYQCAYCSKMAPYMKQIEEKYPKVKFVFKETPIFGSQWEASDYAAKVGLWIYKNYGSKAYNNYHNDLFATNKMEGQLQKSDINTVAKKIGADISKFDNKENTSVDISLFKDLGFQGTPSFIVMPVKNANENNTFVIPGADPNSIVTAIEKVQKQTN